MDYQEPEIEKGYSIRLARNFIYLAYKQADLEFYLEGHRKSAVEGEFGEIPEAWNAGLFRYLDECVLLLNNIQYALLMSLMQKSQDENWSSVLILLNQIKSNCIAIRVVLNHGLDDQARILLRALYENCLALSRSLVDPNFRGEFKKASDLKGSNEFWHRFMSKGKTINYLKNYNKLNSKKCPLVLGDTFAEVISKIGIQTHPNYLYSSHHFLTILSDISTNDTVAANHAASSELVLSSACHFSLLTLAFLSEFNNELGCSARCEIPDAPHSILTRSKTVDVLLKRVGTIAALMAVMLMKWINRNRSDFDPQKHL